MSGLVDNTSPEYFVRHWRKVPEAEEEALDSFLNWLEWDCETEIGEGSMKELKRLVNEYLGRDMSKIQQGEKRLLSRWIEAAGG